MHHCLCQESSTICKMHAAWLVYEWLLVTSHMKTSRNLKHHKHLLSMVCKASHMLNMFSVTADKMCLNKTSRSVTCQQDWHKSHNQCYFAPEIYSTACCLNLGPPSLSRGTKCHPFTTLGFNTVADVGWWMIDWMSQTQVIWHVIPDWACVGHHLKNTPWYCSVCALWNVHWY